MLTYEKLTSFDSINWEINPNVLSNNSNLRDIKYENVFLTLQTGWGLLMTNMVLFFISY